MRLSGSQQWSSSVLTTPVLHGIAFVSSFNITFKYITITNYGVDMKRFVGQVFSAKALSCLF